MRCASVLIGGLLAQTQCALYTLQQRIFVHSKCVFICVTQKLFVEAFRRGKASKTFAILPEKDCQPNDYMKIAQFDASGRIFCKAKLLLLLDRVFSGFLADRKLTIIFVGKSNNFSTYCKVQYHANAMCL